MEVDEILRMLEYFLYTMIIALLLSAFCPLLQPLFIGKICFPFLVGIMGGVGCLFNVVKIMLLAVLALVMALIQDTIKLSVVIMNRKFF
jgi:hypothetical protein